MRHSTVLSRFRFVFYSRDEHHRRMVHANGAEARMVTLKDGRSRNRRPTIYAQNNKE